MALIKFACLAVLAFGQLTAAEEAVVGTPRTVTLTSGANPPADPASDLTTPVKLRMNQMTIFGTHNSYHIPPPDKVLNFLKAVDTISGNTVYGVEAQLNHLPLSEQLATQNVRALELDMYWDPLGGLYADPAGPKMPDIDWIADVVEGAKSLWDKIKDAASSAWDWMKEHLNPANWFRSIEPTDPMKEPGWKVFHRNDFDYLSTCRTFKDCLRNIRSWSDQNPRHLPIVIFLNIKDNELDNQLRKAISGPIADFLDKAKIVSIAKVPDLDKSQLYAAEAEALSVLPREKIFTPDMLRGNRSTVEEAVRANAWPYIDDVLGKIVFVLDGGEDVYRQDSAILENRLFFAFSARGKPDAAFILDDLSLNVSNHVLDGYMVRSRADEIPLPQDPNALLGRAIWQGSQIIMTEVPVTQRANQNPWAQGYSVPSEPRCNPWMVHKTVCPLLLPGGWSEWSTPYPGYCEGTKCPPQTRSNAFPTVRSRNCTNPPPMNGGNPCAGEAEKWDNCPAGSKCVRGIKPVPIQLDTGKNAKSSAPSAQQLSTTETESTAQGDDGSSSNLGLILGITIPLVVLVIVAAILAVVYRGKIQQKFTRGPRSSVVAPKTAPAPPIMGYQGKYVPAQPVKRKQNDSEIQWEDAVVTVPPYQPAPYSGKKRDSATSIDGLASFGSGSLDGSASETSLVTPPPRPAARPSLRPNRNVDAVNSPSDESLNV